MEIEARLDAVDAIFEFSKAPGTIRVGNCEVGEFDFDVTRVTFQRGDVFLHAFENFINQIVCYFRHIFIIRNGNMFVTIKS